MNPQQQLWWRQARSDYRVYELLRKAGAESCHQLHYLQMATEKLAKAYFWRARKPPPKSHTGLVKLIKALVGRHPDDPGWAYRVLGFGRPGDAVKWLAGAIDLYVYPLQNMAPDLAHGGPNPEYPWPHELPTVCPADHDFELWRRLADTGGGRKFLEFIGTAIDRFPDYA